MDLMTKLKDLEERAKQRSSERQQQVSERQEERKKVQVISLPLWPEEMRACPSCVLRSALFGVVQRGRRKYLKRQIIATWPGTTIRYTGIRLDQADLDVWLTALHLSREQGLGARVVCSERAFLRALGRATKNIEWLKDALARLTACAVEITHQGKTYWGSLIQEGGRDEIAGKFVILLNPKLAALFDDVTWQEWKIRCALNRDLAKWLQGYIASHQATASNPHRFGLERLRKLCGSETDELWKFRQQIREAMQELQAAGVVMTWQITVGDALEVIRPHRKKQISDGNSVDHSG
jgi:hypothetical protein